MILYTAVFLVLLAADQILKFWVTQNLDLYESMPLIPGLVELKYIQNTGGGWSILSDYTWLLSLLTSVILVVVLILLVRGIVRHPLGRWGCVLLLAGGLGNLIDRFRLGYVVDMFNFQFMNFPVFNIADICVVCGMALAAVYYLFFYDKYDAKGREKRDGNHPDR